MLDERLIGATFTLQSSELTGYVTLYGIHYHYRVVGAAMTGDLVVVEQVTPLELLVRRATDQLLF